MILYLNLHDMQQTHLNIMANKVKTAQFKLNQHRNLGSKSPMSIHEVARLMDTIKRGERDEQIHQGGIFFSMN